MGFGVEFKNPHIIRLHFQLVLEHLVLMEKLE